VDVLDLELLTLEVSAKTLMKCSHSMHNAKHASAVYTAAGTCACMSDFMGTLTRLAANPATRARRLAQVKSVEAETVRGVRVSVNR
jgi:hypothetical protein